MGIVGHRDHGCSMGLHFTKQCCLPGFDVPWPCFIRETSIDWTVPQAYLAIVTYGGQIHELHCLDK